MRGVNERGERRSVVRAVLHNNNGKVKSTHCWFLSVQCTHQTLGQHVLVVVHESSPEGGTRLWHILAVAQCLLSPRNTGNNSTKAKRISTHVHTRAHTHTHTYTHAHTGLSGKNHCKTQKSRPVRTRCTWNASQIWDLSSSSSMSASCRSGCERENETDGKVG